ncbi:MAG: M20/M25/M40 family metallo-hydrolase [Spirochaetia bacterium]|nr:M20/M25/M40 family metallo-hydrolase [Spirochaetia bacterium]
MKAEMENLGYDQVWVDAYGNVVGRIQGTSGTGRNPRSILFDGHMDTVGVPSPERWGDSPFSGIIKDDILYGRGTADMKCALAAMIYGIAELLLNKAALAGDVLRCAAVIMRKPLKGTRD